VIQINPNKFFVCTPLVKKLLTTKVSIIKAVFETSMIHNFLRICKRKIELNFKCADKNLPIKIILI